MYCVWLFKMLDPFNHSKWHSLGIWSAVACNLRSAIEGAPLNNLLSILICIKRGSVEEYKYVSCEKNKSTVFKKSSKGEFMSSLFWSNTIWFILLGISTVIEMILVLTKSKYWKSTLALYFAICGMTFLYEAAIFCFFKAYNYYPMIIPQSPYDDGLVGNLFSQFSVSATALLIAVLNLKKYWIFIFAVVYVVIEESFLKLGIYSHNWYQTWMTFPSLILLFWVARKLYHKFYQGLNPVLRYIYIFFGLFTLHVPTIKWAFKLSGVLSLNMKILPDEFSSYALLILSNLLLISITCVIIYFSKFKWWWKSVLFLTLYFTLYISCKVNLIHIKEGWFLIFSTIDIFGMYLYIYILDKLLGKTGT